MWTLAITLAACLRLVTLQTPGTPILGQEFWEKNAKEDLVDALKVKYNMGVAKNVILFIGDGMSPVTVTATRIYNGGEESHLVWEKFEHVGLLKTYTNDKTVPDSAATASAMMTGVKGNKGTLGTDATVKLNDCPASQEPIARTVSNLLHFQRAGKATGIVTTTRVTHATPAGAYAVCPNRDWECNDKIPDSSKTCKDIALQLIEEEPGRNLNVILGGGKQGLAMDNITFAGLPMETHACNRSDSRNLIQEWLDRQASMSPTPRYAYVNNTGGLKNLDTSKLDRVLGIFANSHLPFNCDRDRTDAGQPSLELMVTKAVKILNNNPKGFFLMVEGGLIDIAHHRGRARVALDETIEMNKAVNSTLNLLKELNIKDETLLIVTSDHCHGMTINGYPDRGNSILGLADVSVKDGANYTTLMYSTSAPANYQFEVVDGQVKRRDPSLDDTTSWDYHQQATVLNDEAKHEGGDVNIYATGPMAHLFHRVHEQSYVAHVIQYAAEVGKYRDRNALSSSTVHLASSMLAVAVISVHKFL